MKLLVINGPNLNLLGLREPQIYGTQTYAELVEFIKAEAKNLDAECDVYQTNHEGDIIDRLQSAIGVYDGIVINPGGYSHYSVAIADAIRAINLPCIEVHLSDIFSREDYRRKTVTGDACTAIISGKGFDGYAVAMRELAQKS